MPKLIPAAMTDFKKIIEKNNVTSTTIHTVFLRDSLSSIKIEGAEFGNFQGNDKVKKDAEKAFNKIVPEQFRGFLSSFMMQGGISNLFVKNISNSDVKQEDRIHPLLPELAKLSAESENRLRLTVGVDNSIRKRDDGTLEIRTVVRLNGGPESNFDGLTDLRHLSSHDNGAGGGYRLKGFEIVHVIDPAKGVKNEPGIPKGVPQDMKLESVTVIEPQDHSAIDDF